MQPGQGGCVNAGALNQWQPVALSAALAKVGVVAQCRACLKRPGRKRVSCTLWPRTVFSLSLLVITVVGMSSQYTLISHLRAAQWTTEHSVSQSKDEARQSKDEARQSKVLPFTSTLALNWS